MTLLCSKNGYSHNRVEIVHGLRNQGPKANVTENLNQSKTNIRVSCFCFFPPISPSLDEKAEQKPELQSEYTQKMLQDLYF